MYKVYLKGTVLLDGNGRSGAVLRTPNGWEVRSYRNGDVKAVYIENGTALVFFMSTRRNYFHFYSKADNKKKMLRKGIVVLDNRNNPDGILFLSSGLLHERTAFYRERSLQKWLDDRRITSVRTESPNRRINISSYCAKGEEDRITLYVKTNGHDINCGLNPHDVNIENATWTLVVCIDNIEPGKTRRSSVLYTKELRVTNLKVPLNVCDD